MLPDGVAIQDGFAREEITAVRDNVIRVRIARNGVMPENASWAVLPDALHSQSTYRPNLRQRISASAHIRCKCRSTRAICSSPCAICPERSCNRTRCRFALTEPPSASIRQCRSTNITSVWETKLVRWTVATKHSRFGTLTPIASRNRLTPSTKAFPSSWSIERGSHRAFFSTIPGAPASTSAKRCPGYIPSAPWMAH